MLISEGWWGGNVPCVGSVVRYLVADMVGDLMETGVVGGRRKGCGLDLGDRGT
jgi:hypothetical protein